MITNEEIKQERSKAEVLLEKVKKAETKKKAVRVDKNTWILIDKKADPEKRIKKHLEAVESYRSNK